MWPQFTSIKLQCNYNSSLLAICVSVIIESIKDKRSERQLTTVFFIMYINRITVTYENALFFRVQILFFPLQLWFLLWAFHSLDILVLWYIVCAQNHYKYCVLAYSSCFDVKCYNLDCKFNHWNENVFNCLLEVVLVLTEWPPFVDMVWELHAPFHAFSCHYLPLVFFSNVIPLSLKLLNCSLPPLSNPPKVFLYFSSYMFVDLLVFHLVCWDLMFHHRSSLLYCKNYQQNTVSLKLTNMY